MSGPQARSNNEEETRAKHDARLKKRRRVRLGAFALALVIVVALALAARPLEEEGAEAGPQARKAVQTDCERGRPPPKKARQFRRPPVNALRTGVDYRAVVRTTCGDIVIDLLEAKAPRAVSNFVFLARNDFYRGLIWHRVERDFVIQTGDPNGSVDEPPNGPGYAIDDELPTRAREYVFGVVAMANAGRRDSGGSQFFIVVHKEGPAGLHARYTIFGNVARSSFETLKKIGRQRVAGGTDPAESVMPLVPIYIRSIEIIERRAGA